MGALVVRQGLEIQPKPLTWLWPGYLLQGKLTLLVGDPTLGKSWVTLDAVARLTTGRSWPDGAPGTLGRALVLSAEDDPDDTIRPRLDRLGADPANYWVAEGDEFNLQDDLASLAQTVAKHSVHLVVIDPLTAYIGRINSFKDSEVRGLLKPVSAMARRAGAAILAVMHLNKDAQRQAIHRILGSMAFPAAPRAIYAVSADPSNEDRRLLIPMKMNADIKPATLAFQITVTGPVWEAAPVTRASADAVLAGQVVGEDRTERDDAVEFLQEILSTQPEVPVKDVNLAARASGHSDRAIRRARKFLRTVKRFDRSGGKYGGWWLSLPLPSCTAMQTNSNLLNNNGPTIGTPSSTGMSVYDPLWHPASYIDIDGQRVQVSDEWLSARKHVMGSIGAHRRSGEGIRRLINWDEIKEDGDGARPA